MRYPTVCLFNKWGLLLGLLLAALSMAGCEGGKEEGSASALQGQSNIQPGISVESSRIETLKLRLFDEPENDTLLSALGDAYFEERRFQEAIPIYEKAVQLNPNNYDALNDLGLSYFYTRNEMAALDALDRAVAVKPDYKYAWLSKGYILVSVGRYNEAEAPLLKAKELDPDGNIGVEADNFLKKIEEFRAKLPQGG